MKNEKKYSDGLKALFVVVGAVVTIGAVLFTLYTIFKKYFKITFECNTGNAYDTFGDVDNYEPSVCFCDDDCCDCCCDESDELFPEETDEAEEL